MRCGFMPGSVIAGHARPDLPSWSCSFPCTRSHRQTGQKRPIQQTCFPCYFGRLAMRSTCPADPCMCVTRNLGLCSDLSWETRSSLRCCNVCETSYIYINIYKHQCIYTSDTRAIMYTSVYIYIRETLRSCHLPKETLARVCKQSSVKSS